jgi:uncharacterized protein YndB with AHSA1/START domain
MTATANPTSDRELVLTRIIDAPREKLFRAWTDPDLLKQWFAPLPYTTPVAELDVRPGGANLVACATRRATNFPTAASTSKWSRTSGWSSPMPIAGRGSLRRSRS